MQSNPNERLGSTTWEWRRVKITERRRPTGDSAAKGGTTPKSAQNRSHLEPREARAARTIQIRYRGGPEAWWELKWANNTVRVSGVIALHDVMRQLFNSPEL